MYNNVAVLLIYNNVAALLIYNNVAALLIYNNVAVLLIYNNVAVLLIYNIMQLKCTLSSGSSAVKLLKYVGYSVKRNNYILNPFS